MGTKPHLFLSQVDDLITWQETHSLSKIPREDCHETLSSVVRGGEQSQLIPELVSGKVSVTAHLLLLELTLGVSLQTGDCKALLTSQGAEGTGRGNQREWGTGKGPVQATQRVQGDSGGELIHLLSYTPSSLALLWKYQCFLLEAGRLEHFLLPWGLALASMVGGREWSLRILEVTPCDIRECLGALLCPHSWEPALQKEKQELIL